MNGVCPTLATIPVYSLRMQHDDAEQPNFLTKPEPDHFESIKVKSITSPKALVAFDVVGQQHLTNQNTQHRASSCIGTLFSFDLAVYELARIFPHALAARGVTAHGVILTWYYTAQRDFTVSMRILPPQVTFDISDPFYGIVFIHLGEIHVSQIADTYTESA